MVRSKLLPKLLWRQIAQRVGRPLFIKENDVITFYYVDCPTDDGNQILEAEVPMAEMTSYAIDLRSLTQSRGSFTFHFVRYEEAPPAAQQKAIADAKAIQEEG